MDSHSTTLILILIVLVALSAYFSATETAFSSLNRIRLKNLAAGGNKRAKLAYALSENYDELLSTILVGNNIVNIASASIATVLFVNALGEGIGPTEMCIRDRPPPTYGELARKNCHQRPGILYLQEPGICIGGPSRLLLSDGPFGRRGGGPGLHLFRRRRRSSGGM